MKKLVSIPTENLINWYDDVVSLKIDIPAKTILEDIRLQINDRYNHYIERFSSEQMISITNSLFARNHPALLSCYKSEGKTLTNLKTKIRDLQENGLKGTCQYCGVSKPNSMDHYLPISDYPEFSILGINLIPCCTDCNGKKRSYWKDGARGIINFYLDEIPDEQFLFATVHFIGNVPSLNYELRNDNNLHEDFFEILSKHFNRLELIPLYKTQSSDELDEIIRALTIYVDNPNPAVLRNNLLKDASQLQVRFGINYWRAVMRIGLAESDDFLIYIIDDLIIQ